MSLVSRDVTEGLIGSNGWESRAGEGKQAGNRQVFLNT